MSNGFLVPTGYIIKDYLEEIGINQKELAKRMGMSEKHISNLLNGKSKLTEEFAIKLEKIIHAVPASYWLNYEVKYREYKARNELTADFDDNTLKTLDKKFNFSTIFTGLGLSLREQADEMLKLLRISSFDQFDQVYSDLGADFMEDGGKKEAIAIWLNLAIEELEIQNKELDVQYSVAEFKKSLPLFKKLALNKKYESSLRSARKLLNRLGVYLVVCEAIPNSKVRGALTTYKKQPTILLSGRFKTHDHVWFALMHEVGHLLLHYTPNEFLITMENVEVQENITRKEKEANQFARDFFVNHDDYLEFIRAEKFDKKTIEKFAQSQGILPGIVVARLQREEYLPYDQLNFLKDYSS